MKKLKIPVKASLFDHQKKAFEFAMNKFENGGSVALLIEMGCGKSLISVAVSGALFGDEKVKKLLIVCPLSICEVWEEKFSK